MLMYRLTHTKLTMIKLNNIFNKKKLNFKVIKCAFYKKTITGGKKGIMMH